MHFTVSDPVNYETVVLWHGSYKKNPDDSCFHKFHFSVATPGLFLSLKMHFKVQLVCLANARPVKIPTVDREDKEEAFRWEASRTVFS